MDPHPLTSNTNGAESRDVVTRFCMIAVFCRLFSSLLHVAVSIVLFIFFLLQVLISSPGHSYLQVPLMRLHVGWKNLPENFDRQSVTLCIGFYFIDKQCIGFLDQLGSVKPLNLTYRWLRQQIEFY